MRKALNFFVILVPTLIVTWLTFFQMINSETNISEFLVQSIGGGVGSYRAFLVLIATLLFVFIAYLGKKTAFGVARKSTSIGFYVASLIGLFAFLLIGSEFSAPKYTFAPLFKFKQGYYFGRVVEQSGIEFKLDKCSKSGTKITCHIDLYNSGKDDVLKYGKSSYLIDNANNRANVTNFTIGTQSYGHLGYNGISFPVQSKATLQVSFETKALSDSTLVRALYLNIRFDGKSRQVTFRNIEL
ncbi:hypothetical protein [Marinomonas aquiplantarum]|uniref:Uncharacterized protein n=1 Tax=Marinomonas aquiplantarum TaxID=491951 RepID=A0A366CXK1_9GAMM|nr:hypothetical protein [Marinomonas aquiplantarum]RBO82543.1 hypothetical protein DFP76_1057 [Marinomonas aquiplantarum]